MSFEKATRKAQPVMLSLAGRSGSGKTYSALLLAKGLVGDEGKIAVIDTERGRASMYADDPSIGEYYTAELHPPFSPQRFTDKLQEAIKWGANCIIIDSVSHEWSGIGGVLEQVDKMIEQHGQRYRMPAWGKMKPAHNQFVNHLTMAPCHVICCVRAKKKLVEQIDPKTNKKEWVELPDLVAEQQENFVYEMTAAALIDEDHKAKWTKVPEPLKGVLIPGVINKGQGEAIRDWVNGGVAYDEEINKHLSELRIRAGNKGLAAMEEYWNKTVQKQPKPVQIALKTHTDDLKKMAVEADEIRQRAEQTDKPEVTENPFSDQFTEAKPNGNGHVAQ